MCVGDFTLIIDMSKTVFINWGQLALSEYVFVVELGVNPNSRNI